MSAICMFFVSIRGRILLVLLLKVSFLEEIKTGEIISAIKYTEYLETSSRLAMVVHFIPSVQFPGGCLDGAGESSC